jgi:hypothetical protein
MALIRRSQGSELYIYEGDAGFTCSACPGNQSNTHLPDKETLKEHIGWHKNLGHAIGLVGNMGDFQSYDELLKAVDDYEMADD